MLLIQLVPPSSPEASARALVAVNAAWNATSASRIATEGERILVANVTALADRGLEMEVKREWWLAAGLSGAQLLGPNCNV
jgi:hypothetical protein